MIRLTCFTTEDFSPVFIHEFDCQEWKEVIEWLYNGLCFNYLNLKHGRRGAYRKVDREIYTTTGPSEGVLDKHHRLHKQVKQAKAAIDYWQLNFIDTPVDCVENVSEFRLHFAEAFSACTELQEELPSHFWENARRLHTMLYNNKTVHEFYVEDIDEEYTRLSEYK